MESHDYLTLSYWVTTNPLYAPLITYRPRLLAQFEISN